MKLFRTLFCAALLGMSTAAMAQATYEAADGVIVDRFDYLPSMHSRLLRNKAGVSLERRSFARPANAAGNWFSASSVCGYGTPGYENSQSMETLAEERGFVFSSNVVSPDGDDYQDVLEIDYEVEDGELMGSVEVFDAQGVRVRALIDGFLLGTHGTIIWDGLADGEQESRDHTRKHLAQQASRHRQSA